MMALGVSAPRIWFLLGLTSSFLTVAHPLEDRRAGAAANYTIICSKIASMIAFASDVHYPGTITYEELTRRYAQSAGESPACAVEPKSPDDVGTILKIVGRSRTPFAVQSGGHSANIGFSSTKGVHISLRSFRSIEYSNGTRTVDFGTGLRWEDVYTKLDTYGVNVVGGRAAGVGVGGFTLGGGYSYQTNEYGLTLDSAMAFELVKPTGEVVRVDQRTEPDLFFALRGAPNNYGVVTKITLKTFPQGRIWGGIIAYADPTVFSEVAAVTSKMANEVKDPKAMFSTGVIFSNGSVNVGTVVFYNAPSPPIGIFDDILNIPSAQHTIQSQSYLSFFNGISTGVSAHVARTYFSTVPVPHDAHSTKFLKLVNDLTQSVGTELTLASKSFISLRLNPEPFVSTMLNHSITSSAYPYTRSKVYCPMAIGIEWSDPSEDGFFKAAIERVAKALEDELVAEGHDDVITAPLYPNYVLGDTPLRRVDPENVMGLAGGFKI
ncbi:FAD-binding domain-containing protein [Ephemerocybe angulata]|uniref:FAD-binding domain-containing protein n=1 Tax=Ephemerocybe angulata TaxID=980116 RepID=A0A8H6H761_9AGAR|nr:FAD-binding domain-containing protein [Tulosesus angulatus]